MNKYTAQAHQEMTAMYEARLFFNGISIQEIDWAVEEEQKCHKETADFERELIASLPYESRVHDIWELEHISIRKDSP